MYYLGLVFAFLAALAFLVFLRGFLSGSPHLFTISGNEGHLHHHRVRQTWGVLALLAIFIVWEIVRTVAHWVTG